MINQRVKEFLRSNPKYKLVFDLSSSLTVDSVDVGFYLSRAIQQRIKDDRLNMYANDAFRDIIKKFTHEDAEMGDYIAIRNIGILFEPALSLGLESIIEQTSKDKLLIVQSNGRIENGVFYFCPSSRNFSINLKNLNYTVVE